MPLRLPLLADLMEELGNVTLLRAAVELYISSHRYKGKKGGLRGMCTQCYFGLRDTALLELTEESADITLPALTSPASSPKPESPRTTQQPELLKTV